MIKRRAVITGLGVIAPNGIGKEDFWEANLKGRSGIEKIQLFDDYDLEVRIAGQVKDFDPFKYIPAEVAKRTDRFVHLGLSAAKFALEDSKLELEKEDCERIGAIVGSGLGGQAFHEEQLMNALKRGFGRINPLSVPRVTPNAVASHIAIQFGLKGANMVISSACASGAHAVGEGFRKIQNGDLDVCVAGGVEAPLTPFTFAAYVSLKVLSKNNSPQEASRPFDKERDGFVLSEGSAILVLEEFTHALKRNAHIYAEVAGYAANSGAHHIAMPMLTGEDAAAAMRCALKDACINPEDIDYINAHGTSTQANDKAETLAIKKVFGDYSYKIPVSSTKSMIGHTIGAGGAIEALVCSLAVENDLIPPTINYKNKDPDCDLDYVPGQARGMVVRTALSNSFGFGNCNACIILRKENG